MPPPMPAGARRYLVTLADAETDRSPPKSGLAAASALTARRAMGLRAEAERLGMAEHLVWIGPPTAFGMVAVACTSELADALRSSALVARIEAQAD